MKKPLLLLFAILAFASAANAQSAAKVDIERNYITFYDAAQQKYIPFFEYKELYGDDALNSAIDRAIEDNSVQLIRNYKGINMYYHKNTNRYYTYDKMVSLFGEDNANNIINDLKAQQSLLKAQSHVVKNKKAIQENSKIILKSNNLVVGCSMIGGALGIYAIGNEIINSSAKKVTDVDKLKKMDSSRAAVAWVSGAVSVAGVVVILTGIQKVKAEGYEIGKNAYLDSANGGVKFTMKF